MPSAEKITGGYRGLLKLALPMLACSAALIVMQFCDRMFLSWYGENEFNASLPAGVLSFTLVCFFFAVGGYSSTLVAQYHGAGEHDKCVRSTAQGVWWVLLTSPVLLLMPSISNWLLRVIKHAPELAAMEHTYILWMFAAAIPHGLSWALSGYFTGRSKMRLILVTNILGCVVNLVLDYLMIFGKLGFPEMGIKGAAAATFYASWSTPIILAAYILTDKSVRAMGYRTAFAFDRHIFGTLVRFGIPSGLTIFLDVGAFTVFTLLAAKTNDAAASTAAFTINNLAFSPLMSIGLAASVICGQFKGADNFRETMRSGWIGMKTGLVYMALIAFVFMIIPRTLLMLFTPEDDPLFDLDAFIRTGKTLILLLTIWGFFDTVNITISGALKGVGDTKFVMWYTAFMGWLLWIPGEILIFRKIGYNSQGLVAGWIWMTVYIAILAVGFIWRWNRGRWYAIQMID